MAPRLASRNRDFIDPHFLIFKVKRLFRGIGKLKRQVRIRIGVRELVMRVALTVTRHRPFQLRQIGPGFGVALYGFIPQHRLIKPVVGKPLRSLNREDAPALGKSRKPFRLSVDLPWNGRPQDQEAAVAGGMVIDPCHRFSITRIDGLKTFVRLNENRPPSLSGKST